MAIAYVRDTGKVTWSNTGTSASLTFASKPSAGNLILALFSGWHSSGYGLTSVTDNQGGSYTNTASGLGANSTTQSFISHSANNPASGGATHTITVDHSQASENYGSSIGVEFSGIATTTPLDQSAVAVSSSTSTDAAVGPTSTLAQADELVLAIMSQASNDTNINATTPTDYTQLMVENNSSSFNGHQASYRIVAATTAVSAAWTHDNTDGQSGWSAVIATFKGAAAAGGLSIPIAYHHYRTMHSA